MGPYSAWQSRADGTGSLELLLEDARSLHYAQWSPDGEWMVFRTGVDQPTAKYGIVGFRPGVDTAAVDLVATPASTKVRRPCVPMVVGLRIRLTAPDDARCTCGRFQTSVRVGRRYR